MQTTDNIPLLREARPDVSREIEEVLRRAVRGDPAQRYANAAAFREALDLATGGVLKKMLALLRVS